MFVILFKFAIRQIHSHCPKISLNMVSGDKSFFYHCAIRIIAYDLFSDIKKKRSHQVTFISGGSSSGSCSFFFVFFQLEEGFYKS